MAALTGTLPDEYRDDSVHILTQALAAPDDEVRAMAVIGLGDSDRGGPTVVPALNSAIHDGCEQVRRRAVRSLGDLGRASLLGLPHLIAALRDPITCVRLEAMSALGRIGPDAEPAVPYLVFRCWPTRRPACERSPGPRSRRSARTACRSWSRR